MSALKPGHPLDQRFTLLRALGRGGSAEVWLVRDRELEEEVAAKIVPAMSEERLALLRRECRQVRRLVHPNIARVFDYHRGADVGFVTMDHVDGEPLGRLRGAPLDVILRRVVPVADALDYAHRKGVVHRDVKAGNVVCDAEGNPHLLDFGIAGLLDGAEEGDAISGGGTPGGMSPQQRDGAEPSTADDIYSFGAMLYDLVSGDATGGNAGDGDRPAGPSWPPRLRSLLERTLSARPEERPATMAEVKAELVAILKTAARAEADGPSAVAETLTAPPRLTPPPRVERSDPVAPRPFRAREVTPERPASRGAGAGRWVTGIALVAVLALIVFVVLPQLAERWITPGPLSEDAVDPGSGGGEPSEEIKTNDGDATDSTASAGSFTGDRRAADDALGLALKLQDELEAQAVTRWGGDAYRDATASLSRGDELLTDGDFASAEESYRDAQSRFEALVSDVPAVLAAALSEGRAALLAGDSRAATEAYGLATAIDSSNAEAATGLRRAGSADEVAVLLDTARERERARDLAGAERAFGRVVALDAQSSAAREGLARVREGLADDAFARTMSVGLGAIDEGDYPSAREALTRAGTMRPGSAEVADALTRLDNAERSIALAGHRRAARELEAAENWDAAIEHYEQAIALDATVRFAREGLARATMRADVARRIDYHLAHPDRLSSGEVLEEVESLLDEANEIEADGPRHREQVTRLARLAEESAQFIPVLLESDERTEVTIYKIGRLGAFLTHELELRPGVYTVVGSRRGYRDVRHRLVVAAGSERVTLVIRCEEKI